ncbi:MAG: isoleucyl-tRNA synthetase [Gaeavirus sp.]|uniref:Isoleucyl-tRNA synthetase n=1 Tax=Gaeavirus sp. TaxID=2487767 RepID=A0A3G4ZYE7_9VIRU|nr:MAG: isoleucyl-tRNA synthetase [Gaeavirus sp.]
MVVLISIHLINTLPDYITIPKSKIQHATDFDIIYNVINVTHQIRGSININLKKPIRNLSIVLEDTFEDNYSPRYKDYLSIISQECNVLDIKLLKYSDLTVETIIKPVKSLFFKTYGKAITNTYNELTTMNSTELKTIIDSKTYNGFEINSILFDYNNNISIKSDTINDNNIYKEFSFGLNKITIIVDKYYDEEIDKLYYYRLTATRIQRSRKLAGLHPWDDINVYYSEEPKYNLESEDAQKIIHSITKCGLIKYSDEKIFYEKKFDEIGIKLHLANVTD